LIKIYDEINWAQHAEKINDLNKQVQDLKKSSDAYELIVNQLKEVEKNLKQANDKRDNLITNLSKLDDEFNKKNLRKLSLN
ncbi:hypothetical protein LAM87_24490, partial [Mycobacterium tuberculosis]|nr:hypothetical protein [Mycobacterium tuberculosis]